MVISFLTVTIGRPPTPATTKVEEEEKKTQSIYPHCRNAVSTPVSTKLTMVTDRYSNLIVNLHSSPYAVDQFGDVTLYPPPLLRFGRFSAVAGVFFLQAIIDKTI